MIIYGGNDYRDYLAHYGIKGMKWKNHQYASVVNGEYVYNNIATGMSGRSKAFDSERNRIKTMILSKGKFKKSKPTDESERLLEEVDEKKTTSKNKTLLTSEFAKKKKKKEKVLPLLTDDSELKEEKFDLKSKKPKKKKEKVLQLLTDDPELKEEKFDLKRKKKKKKTSIKTLSTNRNF